MKQFVSGALRLAFALIIACHAFAQGDAGTAARNPDRNVSPSPRPDRRSLKEAVGDRFKLGVGVGHLVVRQAEDAD